MGMDLSSKTGNLYYQFNIFGWRKIRNFLERLGCDVSEFSGSNDGDLVSPETCSEIADRMESRKNDLKYLMTCPKEELPKHLSDTSIVVDYEDEDASNPFNPKLKIIESRLKGDEIPLSILKYVDGTNKWDEWALLAYYMGFGDFCRGCSKLGGFTQW